MQILLLFNLVVFIGINILKRVENYQKMLLENKVCFWKLFKTLKQGNLLNRPLGRILTLVITPWSSKNAPWGDIANFVKPRNKVTISNIIFMQLIILRLIFGKLKLQTKLLLLHKSIARNLLKICAYKFCSIVFNF